MRAGILGGGQLARMLALAGAPLGIQPRVWDAAPDACAGEVAELFSAGFAAEDAARAFAEGLELATYEFENIPQGVIAAVAERVPVWPPPKALEIKRDRLAEKTFLQRLEIPVAPFAPVDGGHALPAAIAAIGGLPGVLKTRHLGYDGKGQRVLRTPADASAAEGEFRGVPCVLERFIPFEREVSLVSVLGRTGETRFYPLAENTHVRGILWQTRAPAPSVPAELAAQAHGIAQRIGQALNYAGVLAIEFFQAGPALLVNELAPRVHNSGHWTLEGAPTSQFENHWRAVLGWPLGDTSARGQSVMLNLIGSLAAKPLALATPGAHWHEYGKPVKPGRKVGHITICAETLAAVQASVAALAPHCPPVLA